MKKSIFILLFLTYLSTSVFAQSPSTLYLKFDNNHPKQSHLNGWELQSNNKYVKYFFYSHTLYISSDLDLVCWDKETYCLENIPIAQLPTSSIVTAEEQEALLANKTRQERKNYWDTIENLYVIEINGSTFTKTKVKVIQRNVNIIESYEVQVD